MKDGLTRALSRYQRTFARLHHRAEGRRRHRHRSTAARRLPDLPLGLDAQLRAAVQQPVLLGRLRGDRQARLARASPTRSPTAATTIMVPQDQVYATRISLSGAGLPEQLRQRLLDPGQAEPVDLAVPGADQLQAGDGGRALHDHRGDQRRRHRGRAPRAPAEAGLRRQAGPGDRLGPGRDPAGQHAWAPSRSRRSCTWSPRASTASSRTRSPSPTPRARVLSATDATGGTAASSREPAGRRLPGRDEQRGSRRCSTACVGPGNSTVAVTANLDFDKSVSETKSYTYNKNERAALADQEHARSTPGTGGGSSLTGVVGPGRPDGLHRHCRRLG